MKRRFRFLSPLSAAFLIASLATPPQSAYALRPRVYRAGLEEKFQTNAGLEEEFSKGKRVASFDPKKSEKRSSLIRDIPTGSILLMALSAADKKSGENFAIIRVESDEISVLGQTLFKPPEPGRTKAVTLLEADSQGIPIRVRIEQPGWELHAKRGKGNMELDSLHLVLRREGADLSFSWFPAWTQSFQVFLFTPAEGVSVDSAESVESQANQGPPVPAPSDQESAPVREASQEAPSAPNSSGPYAGPDVDTKSATFSEKPDEETLIGQISKEIRSIGIFYDRILGVAMTDSQNPAEWQKRIPLVMGAAAAPREGDIVIVQEGALKGRGAWLSDETGTLYFEPRALSEADPEMIRVAITRGELDYLNAGWAAKHRVEPPAPPSAASTPTPTSKPATRPITVKTGPTQAVSPPKIPSPAPLRTLKDEMIPLVSRAARGEMLVNSTQVEHRPAQEKTVIRINARDSKTSAWGSFIVPIEFGPEPIFPDVRGLPNQQLEAEFDWGEPAIRMRARNAAAGRLYTALTRTETNLSELFQGAPEPAQRWIQKNAQDLSEALEAALADQPQPPMGEGLRSAAEQVSRAIRREAEGVGELLRLQDRLRKLAVDGKSAAAEISSAFDSLPVEVRALPENAARIRFHQERLLSQREPVSLLPELNVLTDLVDLWRFQNRENLSASAEPADLHAVYYRSAMEALQEAVRVLDLSADPAQVGWNTVALGRLTLRLELERCCLELLRERPAGRPPGILLSYPDNAVGLLFLDSSGQPRRFVEGGGASWSVSNVQTAFSPDQIAEWFEPGDSAVVPIYFSLTGSPTSYSLATFLARQALAIRNRIQTRRGAQPEVWLGTLDGQGALRLFRPTLPPMDSPEWQDHFLPVVERDEKFLEVWMNLREEVLTAPDQFRSAAARARGGTLSAGHLTSSFGQQAQQRLLRQAVLDWISGKLRSAKSEVEAALRPFGRRAARRFVQEGIRRFSADWGEITPPPDSPKQEQLFRLERWALMTTLLADENLVARLLPQLFSQQQVDGATESSPPELLDLDRPPGDLLQPGQLGERLGKLVAQLFDQGIHLPNQIVLDRSSLTVAVDLSDLPDPGFLMTRIDDQLTSFQAFPFIPTAGLPGEPIRFFGERGLDSPQAVLRESSPLSAELWGDALPILTELSRQAPGEAGRKLFSELADRTRAALGQGNPAQQIAALKRERASDAGPIDAALADIAQAVRRELDLFDAIHQASTLVKTDGPVSVAHLRKILSDLQAKSIEHPPVEAAVGGYLGFLPTEGEVSASDWQDRIEALRAVGRRELELGLAAHPSELLQAVYYDAVRLTFLAEVDRFLQEADQASDQGVWERLIERWIVLLLRVVGNELEAGVTARLRRSVKELPAAARFGEFRFGGIGVGFLSAEGKVRLIPGGGGQSIRPHAGTQFDPRWIKAWFLPGERVILFYSSRTGGLHAEQFIAAVDDLFYLRRFLPETEVLLCCATPEGQTSFYNVPIPPLEDRAGWGRLLTEAIRLNEASISFENQVRTRSDTSQGNLRGEKWRQHVVWALSNFQQVLEGEITRTAPEQAEKILTAIRKQFRSDLELFRDMKFLQDAEMSTIGAETDAQKRALLRRNKELNQKFKPAQERLWEVRTIIITLIQEALTASVTGPGKLIQPVSPFAPESGPEAESGAGRRTEEGIQHAIGEWVSRAEGAQGWLQQELEAFSIEWLDRGQINGRTVRAVLEAGAPIRQVDFNNAFKLWKAEKDQAAAKTRQAAALARQEGRREQAAVVKRVEQMEQQLRTLAWNDAAAVEAALARAREEAALFSGEPADRLNQAIQAAGVQFLQETLKDLAGIYDRFLEAGSIPPEDHPQRLRGSLVRAEELAGPIADAAVQEHQATVRENLDWMGLFQRGQELLAEMTYQKRAETEQIVVSAREAVATSEEENPRLAELLNAEIMIPLITGLTSSVMDELPRIYALAETDAQQYWDQLVGFRPDLQRSIDFLIEFYGEEDQRTLRETLFNAQQAIETMARQRALQTDRDQPAVGHRMTLEAPLRLVHRYSGRELEIRYTGEVEKPAQGVRLARFSVLVPRGWVPVLGNELALAQKKGGDWRKSMGLKHRLDRLRRAEQNKQAPPAELFQLRDFGGEYGISGDLWVVAVDKLEGWMKDPNMIVARSSETGKTRLQDLYAEFHLQLNSISNDYTRVQVTLDDPLGLFEVSAAGPSAELRTGLEENQAELTAPSHGLEIFLTPSNYRPEISRLVRQAQEGVPGVNQTVTFMNGFRGGDNYVTVDVNGQPDLLTDNLLYFARFNPKPIMPDPRSIHPAWRRYTGSFNGATVLEEMYRRPAMARLMELGQGDMDKKRDDPAWLREILEVGRRVLEEPVDGKTVSDRLQAILDSYPDDQRLIAQQAVEVVQRTEQELQRINEVLLVSFLALREAADEEWETPVEQVRSEFKKLFPQLEPYPRVQQGVLSFLNGLPPQGTLPLPLVREAFIGAQNVIRSNTIELLTRQIPGWALTAVYYEALRATHLRSLPTLEQRLRDVDAGEDPSEALKSHVAGFGAYVTVIEMEAAITESVRKSALPETQPGRPSPHPLGGIGVLLIDSAGQARLVPGGGTFYAYPLGSIVRFPAARLQPYLRSGDRVVLMVPSFTGTPTLDQLDGYFESWLLLQKNLPGKPEIWLGVATADGTARLLKPIVQQGAVWDAWDRMKDELGDFNVEEERLVGLLRSAFMKVPQKPDESQSQSRRLLVGSLGAGAAQAGSSDYARQVVAWWHSVTQGFPARLKEVLTQHSGPEVSDQVWRQLLMRRKETIRWMREEVPDVKTLSGPVIQQWFDQLDQKVPPVLTDADLLVQELMASELIRQGWMFEEVLLFPEEKPQEFSADEQIEDKLREFLDPKKLQQNQLGKPEELESFAREWMRRQVADGTDPGEIKFSDFKKAAKQWLSARRTEQTQLVADVNRFNGDAAALAARPDASDAEPMELIERFNSLLGRVAADQKSSLTAAAQPIAERVARIELLLSWVEALSWDEIASRSESLAAARRPTSKWNDSAAAPPSQREIRKQHRRAMVAAIQGRKPAVPAAENEVKPAAAALVLEQEQARLFDQRERRLTQAIHLLTEFPNLRQPLEEEQRAVRSAWAAIELRRLARTPEVSAEEIRESLDRIALYSPELDPELKVKENYDVLARPVAERLSGAVLQETDAALADTAQMQDLDEAGAVLAKISERLREDGQRMVFYRDLAKRIENQKVRIRDAREAVDALKRMALLALALRAEDGAKLQSELTRSAKLLREASPAWKERLVTARRTLAQRYEGQVTARIRPFRETEQEQFGPQEAGELFPQISFALSALSEFPELADRSVYFRESRAALLRAALTNPRSLQEGARFVAAESAFQTVLKQERRNGIGRFLEAAAFGGTVPDLSPVENYAERARDRSQGATRDFYDGVLHLIRLARVVPAPATAPAATAGLEETENGGERYRQGVQRVSVALAEQSPAISLTPGEVWMLGQLADADGHLLLSALDQRLAEWIPPMDGENQIWDIRYRMAIAARLMRELKTAEEAPWRNGKEPYQGRIGFLFGREVIQHPEFSSLRVGRVPSGLLSHLPEQMTLRDVLFLAQGDDPTVPRWKPAQADLTVDQAIAADAVSYKVSVMMPAETPGAEYSPYWNRLRERNLAWVRDRALEARAAAEGLGFGFVAGAILWAAPPLDFTPPEESLRAIDRTADELRQELRGENPADWVLQVVTEAWLASDRKKEVEAGPAFAQAHAELTRQVVERWNQTPGVTLIQIAGPYFVSRQEEMNLRADRAKETIAELAAIPGVKGKILPATRNRPTAVVQEEMNWMARSGLSGGMTAGRSTLMALVSAKSGEFHPMNSHLFRQGIMLAAHRLLLGLEALREAASPGVWSAHGIERRQAEVLIAAVRGPAAPAAGMEETFDHQLGVHPGDFITELAALAGKDPQGLIHQASPSPERFLEDFLQRKEQDWLRQLETYPVFTEEGDLFLLRLVQEGEKVFEEAIETAPLRASLPSQGGEHAREGRYRKLREEILRNLAHSGKDDRLNGFSVGEPVLASIRRGERARELFLVAHLRQLRGAFLEKDNSNLGYLRVLRRYGYSPMEFVTSGLDGIRKAIRNFQEGQGATPTTWVRVNLEKHYRKTYLKTVRQMRLFPLPKETPAPVGGIVSRVRADAALSALEALDPLAQVLTREHFLEGRSLREMALEHGMTESTANRILKRSVLLMRTHPEVAELLNPVLPRLQGNGPDSFDVVLSSRPAVRVHYADLEVEILDPQALLKRMRLLSLEVLLTEIERVLIRAARHSGLSYEAIAAYFSTSRNRVSNALGSNTSLPFNPSVELPANGFKLGTATTIHNKPPNGLIGNLERAMIALALEDAGSISVASERLQVSRTALRKFQSRYLAGGVHLVASTGLEEVQKLSLQEFQYWYRPVIDTVPAVRERLIHFTEQRAEIARVIQLDRPLTAHVQGQTLLAEIQRQWWPQSLIRSVLLTPSGVEKETWGFILQNTDALGGPPLNPKGLFVKPVSVGYLPSAEALVAEFYWNQLKVPAPELLLGQMIYSDGQGTYLVLFSA